MNRVAFWLAFGVLGAGMIGPAQAAWTGKPVNDGHGRTYFLASSTVDDTRAEFFCSPEGVVNLSLIWPDRAHPAAADAGAPVDFTVSVDEAQFAATSWYWASGKGTLILDFGDPGLVRDIVKALGTATTGVTFTVNDPENGISKQLDYGVEGADAAAAGFVAWCPAAE